MSSCIVCASSAGDSVPCCGVSVCQNCLRASAAASGSLFACPACRERDVFRAHAVQKGIHIDEKIPDYVSTGAASTNERLCCAERCRSPRGPAFDTTAERLTRGSAEDQSRWRLIPCLSCGGPARRILPEHEWKTVKAILCAYAWMCHAPIGIINYGLALLTCLYFAPYLILVRPVGGPGEGWCTGILHRALFFLFSPYFFLTLAWYSGGLLEWTVGHFALGTLHLRFICLVYIPMYTLVRIIKDRSPW